MWIQSAYKITNGIINLDKVFGITKRKTFSFMNESDNGFDLEFSVISSSLINWHYDTKEEMDKEYNIITNLINLKDLKNEEDKND